MQTFNNDFFYAKSEDDFKKLKSANVKTVRCFCMEPEFAAKMMKKYELDGTLIIPTVIALDKIRLEKCKSLGFNISIMIDLLDDDEILFCISALKIPVTVFLYDDLTKTGDISKKYNGQMPAMVLEDFGFLDRECYIVGGMYAEKDDLQILSDYETTIVLCPRAFSSKGATFTNLKLLNKYPIKIRLGSYDYKEIALNREIEFLRLTSCALFENAFSFTDDEIYKIIND